MYFQVSFLCCFIFTLITGVNNIKMDRFNVCFQAWPLSCFVFTLITGVSDIDMDRVNVSFQAWLLSCFVFTLILGVSNISIPIKHRSFYRYITIICFRNNVPFYRFLSILFPHILIFITFMFVIRTIFIFWNETLICKIVKVNQHLNGCLAVEK